MKDGYCAKHDEATEEETQVDSETNQWKMDTVLSMTKLQWPFLIFRITS